MARNQREKMWLRLDNAAKIFPASMRRGWSNVFRLSATLREPVSPAHLAKATRRACKRYPSVCVRLKRGLFWYYLEETSSPPVPKEEGCQPLYPMTRKEMGQCALRILYYENRIAVEFFHALTDGTGGMTFLKTLVLCYLEEHYGKEFPRGEGIPDPDSATTPEELEDAFLRYAGENAASRDSSSAFRLQGKPESDGFLHVTCATVPVKEMLTLARNKGVSLTALLSASFVYCIAKIQREKVSSQREKAVRVQIPVNLRRFFPSSTVRNFVAVVNVGLEKGETDADFDEILSRVHHQMALLITPRNLKATFTANVKSEKGMAIRLVPLFLKNIVMRAVFDRVGESSACLCLSNLGQVILPCEMAEQVTRFDFIIGPQAMAPYNCGVVSYGEHLRISVVRNTREPELERALFPFLSSLGLDLTLESNER